MAVVSDLIASALKEIGVLAESEVPSASQGADALAALNRLVDQWKAERLQIYSITRTVFTISGGTYTVGTGGTVNVDRPVFLDHVGFQDTSSSPVMEYELSELTDDAYAGLTPKALTSPFPTSWYYNATFPLGALTLWPTPTSATLQGVLYAPAAVAAFAGLTTAISLPPGYEELILTTLALRLATSYGRQIDPGLRERAGEARAIVKRANMRLTDLSFEAGALIGGGGGWDIRTGP